MNQQARVQVDRTRLDEIATERHLERQHELGTAAVYNIWHRKWAGGDKVSSQFRSAFRCNVSNDSGTTRSSGPYFCLWFARGCCHKGSECSYLHRIPQEEDAAALAVTNTTDCFGRAKFSDFREDMSGVGSFLKPQRTLFVGYFNHNNRARSTLSSQVHDSFSEWGTVSSVRLDKKMSFAFVTFSHQCNAEFAKEAMSNQTITGKETIVVRWAQSPKETNPEQLDGIDENRIRQIIRSVLQKKNENMPTDLNHDSDSKPETESQPIRNEEDASTTTAPIETPVSIPMEETEKKGGIPPLKKRRGLIDYD